MSTWQFKPGLIPTFSVMIILPALIALGFWQLDRADQKADLYYQHLTNQGKSPVILNEISIESLKTGELVWRHVVAQGSFDGGSHYLLDNQVVNGRIGYLVFTPFRLFQEDKYVLVNRGWMPAGMDRGSPASFQTPEQVMTLDGVITEAPNTGILLSDDIYENLAHGMVRAQKIDLFDLGKRSKRFFLPVILRLNPASGSDFVRQWRDPASDRNKHLGYAFQWFLLSALLIIVYIVVNLKRMPGKYD